MPRPVDINYTVKTGCPLKHVSIKYVYRNKKQEDVKYHAHPCH